MSPARKIYSLFLDLIETLVIAGAIFVVVYAFLARPFQVSGQSMFPTFKNNEYVLTNIIGLKLGRISRGDVIVFKSPVDKEKDYIKRVIGLPGDVVALKNAKVYINGTQLDESVYLSPDYKTGGGTFLDEGSEVTVPDETYFVMGDNRDFSSDSREWGFVTKDKLIGKSAFVYWPPPSFRTVPKINYSAP